MQDLYQVKWKDGKKTRYGIFQSAKKGIARVNDAILPVYDEVPVDSLVPIKSEWDPPDEFHAYLEKEFEAARKVSEALPEGFQVGKLIQTSVADGYAFYVITKVGRKNIHIEWRGFSPDRWHDQVLGAGGSFPRHAIDGLVRAADGFKKLFRR